MDRPSAEILRLDSMRQPRPAIQPSELAPPTQPPARLNAAARRAWEDIAGSMARSTEADDPSLEAAAVLLARFRETGLEPSLAARLKAVLEELGVSTEVSSRVPPEQALAALSRELRVHRAMDSFRS